MTSAPKTGIRRVEYPNYHRYQIDGKWATGVTTALSAIPKDGLKYWAAGEVAGYVVNNIWDIKRMLDSGGANPTKWFLKEIPFQKRDDAAVRGTEVHALAERYIRGEEIEVPEHLQPYVDGYAQFVDEFNPTSLHEELTVASREHMIAGTLDSIQDIPGYGRSLVDLKTSSGVYGEYALQVAAYRHMEVFLDGDGAEQPMPQVEHTFVLHIKPHDYELLPVQAGPDEFAKFLAALANYRANVQGKQLANLVGQPVLPPSREFAA